MSNILRSYTAEVDVYETIGEIQSMLARNGARSVSTEYMDGTPTGVLFTMMTPASLMEFRLPARMDLIERVMKRQHERGEIGAKWIEPENIARAAWRVCRDWVDSQLSMVEMGTVDFAEVMFPYMLVPGPAEAEGRRPTVYEAFSHRRLELRSVQPPGMPRAALVGPDDQTERMQVG